MRFLTLELHEFRVFSCNLPNFGVKDLHVRLLVPSRKNSTGANPFWSEKQRCKNQNSSLRYRNNNITKVVWTVFNLSHLKNRPQHMSLLLILRTEEVHSLVAKRFRRKQHPHLEHGLDILWEDRPVQFVSTKRPANEESSRHPQHLPNDFHPHEVCRETQTVGLCANRDGWWLFLN